MGGKRVCIAAACARWLDVCVATLCVVASAKADHIGRDRVIPELVGHEVEDHTATEIAAVGGRLLLPTPALEALPWRGLAWRCMLSGVAWRGGQTRRWQHEKWICAHRGRSIESICADGDALARDVGVALVRGELGDSVPLAVCAGKLDGASEPVAACEPAKPVAFCISTGAHHLLLRIVQLHRPTIHLSLTHVCRLACSLNHGFQIVLP